MTRTIDQLIASEVLCCMSSLVATLAQANYCEDDSQALGELKDQAMALAAPIDDWEEAAIQEGWRKLQRGHAANRAFHFANDKGLESRIFYGWKDCCEANGIDPYQREVYEHWAVTDWFADKLEAAGEKVDKDFAGLCIWARTTTGQQIAADGVVQRIYAQTHTGLEG